MTAEMAAIKKKQRQAVTNCGSNREKSKYNSKIPKVTWPPPQYVK